MKDEWGPVLVTLVILLFFGWMDWLDYKREIAGCAQEEQHDHR